MEFIRVKALLFSIGRVDVAASEDPVFVEVEADVWESEQGVTTSDLSTHLLNDTRSPS